jgi:hypothetical protein
VRRLLHAAIAVLIALAVAGCGRDRLDAPDVEDPANPAPAVRQAYPRLGLYFERPGNWPFTAGRAPLVASTASGTASVALWRYPRSEPLPTDTQALADAQQQLETAARNRDPTFAVERSRRTKVDGARAIEVVGSGTIAGQRRRIRSTHVYAKGNEVVIDAYAAPKDFDRLDEAVFKPLVESLP